MILAVGAAALLTGAALVTFLAWIAYRFAVVQNNHILGQVTFGLCVAPFAWFFLESGSRMITGKPSEAGSVLALSTWRVFRVWGAVLAIWFLYLGWGGNLAAALIGALAFGGASWKCHQRIQQLKAAGGVNAAAE
jgi:hypothetical protein